MQRILITGVAGFVGSNLVKYFSGLPDFFVIGHSRNAEKAKKKLEPFKIEMVGEISPLSLNELKINCVIHLAGIAHDLSSQYQPEDYYRVNFDNTKNIYDAFLASNASKFIFLSSIKAAVNTSSAPATEEVIPNPSTDYGKSKRKAEDHIRANAGTNGKRAYIFRPTMIHGPGNKGNLNQLYRFVKLGIPYPFGAFENQRSFLSIDNFMFIVQQFLEQEPSPGIYHLADEGYLSTKELYEIMVNVLGKRRRMLNIPRTWITIASELVGKRHTLQKLTEDMMVSNEKLLKTLNVKLPITFRDGLTKTITSFRE